MSETDAMAARALAVEIATREAELATMRRALAVLVGDDDARDPDDDGSSTEGASETSVEP